MGSGTGGGGRGPRRLVLLCEGRGAWRVHLDCGVPFFFFFASLFWVGPEFEAVPRYTGGTLGFL